MPSRGKTAGIPAPIGVTDPAAQRILLAIKERLDSGSPEARQLAQIEKRLGTVETGGDTGVPIRPVAAFNLAAQGIFGSIILTIDAIPAGAAYVEWLACDVDDLGQAIVVGTSVVPIWQHYVGDGVGRYYWVRGVGYGSAALRGPINKTAGTYARSGEDVEYLKDILDGEIEDSQLAQDLAARIDLIDGPTSLAGSVAQRLLEEAQEREAGLTQVYNEATSYADDESAAALAVNQLVASFGGNAASALDFTVSEVDDQLAVSSQFSELRASFGGTVWLDTYSVNATDAAKIKNADGSVPLAAPSTSFYAYTLSAVTRATGTTTGLVVQFTISDTGTVSDIDIISSRGNSSNHPEIFVDGDGDVAVRLYGHQSHYTVQVQVERSIAGTTAAAAMIKTLRQTTADETGALATTVGQLSTTVGNNTATVETFSESIDGIGAQHVVKIDNNGIVTGYGLASQPAVDGRPMSDFFIRADRFAFIMPGEDESSAVYPVEISGGNLYANTAIFKNASIKDAMIESLGANKVTATSLAAITANLGEVNSGTFRTSAGSAYRAEMSSIGGYPLWFGSGSKSASNGRFYVTTGGDVFARGNIEASSIKAGSANIIDTLMLRDQAVTIPLFVSTDSGASANGDAWTEIQSLNVPSWWPSGTPAVMSISCAFNASASAYYSSVANLTCKIRYRLDGSVEGTVLIGEDKSIERGAQNTVDGAQKIPYATVSGVAYVEFDLGNLSSGPHVITAEIEIRSTGEQLTTRSISRRSIKMIGYRK